MRWGRRARRFSELPAATMTSAALLRLHSEGQPAGTPTGVPRTNTARSSFHPPPSERINLLQATMLLVEQKASRTAG